MIESLGYSFLLYEVPPVGCRPLQKGKLQWLTPWALEEGSVLVQVPALLFPSCAGAWLFPCHAADEIAPPTGLQKHCNQKKRYRPYLTSIWWCVWLKNVKMLPGWNLLLDWVIAGSSNNTIHGKRCWQEVGFLGFFAENGSWKRPRLGHLHHQTDVNDSLNF